jgi:hypothetical protein
MSKGTPLIGLRVPPELRTEIEQHILRVAIRARRRPKTITAFILDCIREVLDKGQRSKKSRQKKKLLKLESVKHPDLEPGPEERNGQETGPLSQGSE